jgi:hypothetical protein
LIFDGDGFDGFGKKMAVGVSEEKNGLFGMIDDAIGQAGLIVFDEGDAIRAGDVFVGDDDEFVPIDAGAEGDGFYFAAGDAATDGGAVEHAGEGEVVDVAGFAGNFAAAFPAGDGDADDGIGFHADSRRAQTLAAVRALPIVYDKHCEARRWGVCGNGSAEKLDRHGRTAQAPPLRGRKPIGKSAKENIIEDIPCRWEFLEIRLR